MKKLNKLEINSEKLMKDEELTALRGGYGGGCCTCREQDGSFIDEIYALSQLECNDFCNEMYDPPYFGAWGDYSC